MAALSNDPVWDDADQKHDRDEAYALDVLGDEATGGYYEDWTPDFMQQDGVLVDLQDALTDLQDALDERYVLLHNIAASFGDAA